MALIQETGYRYIYDGNGQLVVKINETTGERSIYLGSYAEVTYTGAAAATPTPSERCSVSECIAMRIIDGSLHSAGIYRVTRRVPCG